MSDDIFKFRCSLEDRIKTLNSISSSKDRLNNKYSEIIIKLIPHMNKDVSELNNKVISSIKREVYKEFQNNFNELYEEIKSQVKLDQEDNFANVNQNNLNIKFKLPTFPSEYEMEEYDQSNLDNLFESIDNEDNGVSERSEDDEDEYEELLDDLINYHEEYLSLTEIFEQQIEKYKNKLNKYINDIIPSILERFELHLIKIDNGESDQICNINGNDIFIPQRLSDFIIKIIKMLFQ